MSGTCRARSGALALVCLALGTVTSAEGDPFAIQTLDEQGRVTAAEIADLDGDGRGDLFCAVFSGPPGRQRRELVLHFQREDGALPAQADLRAPLPEGAAAYDLAELDGVPGQELLFLAGSRISLFSFSGRHARLRELALPGPSVAVAPDERDIERLSLARSGLAAEPLLLVPGLGTAHLLDARGAPIARLSIGARANYILPPRDGPLFSESEVELSLEVPRLDVADVDGDGRGDVVASARYALGVFLQRPDGSFPEEPDPLIPLSLIQPEDFVRRSGSVRAAVADLDGDGRADLLLSHTRGGLLGATTTTLLFRNRGGRWDVSRPDQRFESGGKGTITDQILDLDGDGRPELLEARIPLGTLDLVRLLLTRHLDAEVAIRRAAAPGAGTGLFEAQPSFQRDVRVGIRFESMRPVGFIPTFEADLDGDGRRDLLSSGDGEALEIFPGDAESGYRRRSARQELDTGGRIHFGQLAAGGPTDFVLFDPRTPGALVRVGRNLGSLTPAPAP